MRKSPWSSSKPSWPVTWAWRHRSFPPPEARFGLEEALADLRGVSARRKAKEAGWYRSYLEQARQQAKAPKRSFAEADLAATERELIPFLYVKPPVAETRR